VLFGAVVPEYLHDFLEEGECVVLLESGPLKCTGSQGHSTDYVLVSRSPSYYPGDLRVLRVKCLPVNNPILHLRNCILFSTKGVRPDPDKMGGGDLDGDKYLVMWHPLILKYSAALRNIPPADYSAPAPAQKGKKAEQSSDWIHYAAMTDNSMLAEVESTFYKVAKKYGVGSPQITKLNSLFSKLVDRHGASVKDFQKLKVSVADDFGENLSVWEEMEALQHKGPNDLSTTGESTKLSQYELFRATATHPSIVEDLIALITNECKHHFLECLLRDDILLTVLALKQLSTDDRMLSRSAPMKLNQKREINQKHKIPEKDHSKIVNRFKEDKIKLFEKQFKKIQQSLLRPTMILEEQMLKEETIRRQYVEQNEVLDAQRVCLEEAELNAEAKNEMRLKKSWAQLEFATLEKDKKTISSY